ncbi:hypothetical protein [Amycolatopsis saalfeldensis]|uniref:Uncharacterized protein n=1 Tax=Amycolatopsis saalfeldensis TaxID=394193 RepID=A0A1H8VWC7_9PSEU|nr:hypothetical protein [Amycolatopsis saalfeldensis]SEP19583.1 hypothetical protein SAMN04489732_104340 [Amycolatopsis saalfeldensis]
MNGGRNVKAVGGPAGRKALLPGVLATLSALALSVASSPTAAASYGLTGSGTASGRAGTLIRPDGLIWTDTGGSCLGTDARITFAPPQPGVTYQIRMVGKGNHPDGNYHPIATVVTLAGPVVNRPLPRGGADPRLEYLFVQATLGNWVSNSHVVGCTPTKPGVVREVPPAVIPIWGLPGYNGADTPNNPNTPPPPSPAPRSGAAGAPTGAATSAPTAESAAPPGAAETTAPPVPTETSSEAPPSPASGSGSSSAASG